MKLVLCAEKNKNSSSFTNNVKILNPNRIIKKQVTLLHFKSNSKNEVFYSSINYI